LRYLERKKDEEEDVDGSQSNTNDDNNDNNNNEEKEEDFPLPVFSSEDSNDDLPITRARRNALSKKKEEKKKKKKESPVKGSNKKESPNDRNDAKEEGKDVTRIIPVEEEEEQEVHFPTVPLLDYERSFWIGLVVRHTISKEIGKVSDMDDHNRVEIHTTWGAMKGKDIHFEVLDRNSKEYLSFECCNALLSESDDTATAENEANRFEEDDNDDNNSLLLPVAELTSEPITDLLLLPSAQAAIDLEPDLFSRKSISVIPPPPINHYLFRQSSKPTRTKLVEVPLIKKPVLPPPAAVSAVLPEREKPIVTAAKDQKTVAFPSSNPVRTTFPVSHPIANPKGLAIVPSVHSTESSSAVARPPVPVKVESTNAPSEKSDKPLAIPGIEKIERTTGSSSMTGSKDFSEQNRERGFRMEQAKEKSAPPFTERDRRGVHYKDGSHRGSDSSQADYNRSQPPFRANRRSFDRFRDRESGRSKDGRNEFRSRRSRSRERNPSPARKKNDKTPFDSNKKEEKKIMNSNDGVPRFSSDEEDVQKKNKRKSDTFAVSDQRKDPVFDKKRPVQDQNDRSTVPKSTNTKDPRLIGSQSVVASIPNSSQNQSVSNKNTSTTAKQQQDDDVEDLLNRFKSTDQNKNSLNNPVRASFSEKRSDTAPDHRRPGSHEIPDLKSTNRRLTSSSKGYEPMSRSSDYYYHDSQEHDTQNSHAQRTFPDPQFGFPDESSSFPVVAPQDSDPSSVNYSNAPHGEFGDNSYSGIDYPVPSTSYSPDIHSHSTITNDPSLSELFKNGTQQPSGFYASSAANPSSYQSQSVPFSRRKSRFQSSNRSNYNANNDNTSADAGFQYNNPPPSFQQPFSDQNYFDGGQFPPDQLPLEQRGGGDYFPQNSSYAESSSSFLESTIEQGNYLPPPSSSSFPVDSSHEQFYGNEYNPFEQPDFQRRTNSSSGYEGETTGGKEWRRSYKSKKFNSNNNIMTYSNNQPEIEQNDLLNPSHSTTIPSSSSFDPSISLFESSQNSYYVPSASNGVDISSSSAVRPLGSSLTYSYHPENDGYSYNQNNVNDYITNNNNINPSHHPNDVSFHRHGSDGIVPEENFAHLSHQPSLPPSQLHEQQHFKGKKRFSSFDHSSHSNPTQQQPVSSKRLKSVPNTTIAQQHEKKSTNNPSNSSSNGNDGTTTSSVLPPPSSSSSSQSNPGTLSNEGRGMEIPNPNFPPRSKSESHLGNNNKSSSVNSGNNNNYSQPRDPNHPSTTTSVSASSSTANPVPSTNVVSPPSLSIPSYPSTTTDFAHSSSHSPEEHPPHLPLPPFHDPYFPHHPHHHHPFHPLLPLPLPMFYPPPPVLFVPPLGMEGDPWSSYPFPHPDYNNNNSNTSNIHKPTKRERRREKEKISQQQQSEEGQSTAPLAGRSLKNNKIWIRPKDDNNNKEQQKSLDEIDAEMNQLGGELTSVQTELANEKKNPADYEDGEISE
jgi:hypothetical protein